LDNTALSFDQIAEFCKLHPLEIKAIADGDAAQVDRPESRSPLAGPRQEGTALHPCFAPPGPPKRHPMAGAQSSGAQGQRDHAPRRHDQVHDRLDP
jgi:hypothetical protein